MRMVMASSAFHLTFEDGQGYDKSAAFINLAAHGDVTLVLFYNFFAKRQSYAGAFVLTFGMQPPEHAKNFFCILLVETNSVILKINSAVFAVLLRAIHITGDLYQ